MWGSGEHAPCVGGGFLLGFLFGMAVTLAVGVATDLQDGRVDRMPPYKVILLDDPVTTMDFVILLLIECFGKDPTAVNVRAWSGPDPSTA